MKIVNGFERYIAYIRENIFDFDLIIDFFGKNKIIFSFDAYSKGLLLLLYFKCNTIILLNFSFIPTSFIIVIFFETSF